jgi:hypothetical protein
MAPLLATTVTISSSITEVNLSDTNWVVNTTTYMFLMVTKKMLVDYLF